MMLEENKMQPEGMGVQDPPPLPPKRHLVGVAGVFVLVAIVAAGIFYWKQYARTLVSSLSLPATSIPKVFQSKCRFPLEYYVGDVDPNFGLSRDDFAKAIQDATRLWEPAAGEPVFLQSSSSGVKVNLVFDERQQQTRDLQKMLSSLTTDKEKYDALKKEFDQINSALDAQKNSYEKQKAAYEKKLADFKQLVELHNEKVRTYEANVAEWNTKGGAPAGVFDQLSATRDAINAESEKLRLLQEQIKTSYESLDTARKAINAKISDQNLLVGILNQYAEKVNAEVATYNAVPREEFEAGLYSKSGAQESITIYQFSDPADLVKVLAHELGHAIGLDHATGTPKAIMYPMMGEQDMRLAPEDMTLLRAYCAG